MEAIIKTRAGWKTKGITASWTARIKKTADVIFLGVWAKNDFIVQRLRLDFIKY